MRSRRKAFVRQVQVTTTQQMYDELNELADKYNQSVASLIREMIENDLPRLKTRRQQALRRARS